MNLILIYTIKSLCDYVISYKTKQIIQITIQFDGKKNVLFSLALWSL